MVVLKEPFLGRRSNYEDRLKNSWTRLINPFTFPRSGWSVVRSASLAKGGTSKERPSPHLHKVPNRNRWKNNWRHQRFLLAVKYYSPTKRRRGNCVGEMADLEQSAAYSGHMKLQRTRVSATRWTRYVNQYIRTVSY
jgi:hypothetical protein